jgi:hypothetical protein
MIQRRSGVYGFVKPKEPLAETLEHARGSGKPVKRPNYTDEEVNGSNVAEGNSTFYVPESSDSTGDDGATKADGEYIT